jgi:lycopene cyclase domain-containing protein
MTYAQLLLVFVVTPAVALGAAILFARYQTRGQKRPAPLWPKLALLLALMGVATLYTIPWDDHLIAIGVWWYRPALLLGLSIGHIPIEEALFFPLQTLLVGAWWIWLTGWASPLAGIAEKRAMDHRRGAVGRVTVFAVGVALWIGALTLLAARWRAGTYLGWEMAWALPPLLLQILVGGDILWRRRWLVGWVVVPAALYLSCVDALAIHLGIWIIDPRQSLGWLIGGQLPIEELVFFLVTSALIGFGLVLGSAAGMRHWVQALFDWREGAHEPI